MKTFLEWLKRRVEWYDEPSLNGEYWIDDSGIAHAADGDIGDVNHEGMVINTLQSQITGGEYDSGEYVDWDQFKKDFAKRVYEERLTTASDEEKQQLIEKYEYDPESFIDEEALETEGIDSEAYKYANDQGGDAREYAMKHWKWKRVQGTNVETWTFDDEDKRILARGLGEVLENEAGDIDDEQANQIEFYIYVLSTGQDFNITLDQLDWQPTDFIQQPEPTAQLPPGSFANFIQQQPTEPPQMIPQPYRDDGQIGQRPVDVDADINLKNKASQNWGIDQDNKNMHPYYKGRLGDWHIPSIDKI